MIEMEPGWVFGGGGAPAVTASWTSLRMRDCMRGVGQCFSIIVFMLLVSLPLGG